jgi:hypothetical protein
MTKIGMNEIGRELASDIELLKAHVPSLIVCKSHRLGTTIAAIGEHTADVGAAWNVIRDAWITGRNEAQ